MTHEKNNIMHVTTENDCKFFDQKVCVENILSVMRTGNLEMIKNTTGCLKVLSVFYREKKSIKQKTQNVTTKRRR